MEKQLLRLLLNYEFFKLINPKTLERLFSDELRTLYNTIVEGHKREQGVILTAADLKAVYEITNPVSSKTQRSSFEFTVSTLFDDAQIPSTNIATELIQHVQRAELARTIAEQCADIISGKSTSLGNIRDLVLSTADVLDTNRQYNIITTDLDELLTLNDDTNRFQFNIPRLREKVGGIYRGEFMNIFARPEVGKTAFWSTLVSAPGGFAHQGLKCAAILNEEPGIRTKLRHVYACTGMTKEEIINDKKRASNIYNNIRNNLFFIDSVDFSIEQLDAYVLESKPDIVIVDNLDKVYIDGTYARDDQRLKAIYVQSREIAKKRNCAFIGISQASAEAEGVRYLNLSQMENSRTGKAAETDLTIGIGANPTDNNGERDNLRYLNVIKNKITGWHGVIPTLVNKELSRYEE